MNENERFRKNEGTAIKIAELFGLRLMRFNPNWELYAPNDEDGSTLCIFGQVIGYLVTDDMMGKIATLLGFDWVLERDDEVLLARIREHEIVIEREKNYINNSKQMCRKLDVKEVSTESSQYLIKSREESIERLKGVLKTRERLKSYLTWQSIIAGLK